MRRRHLFAVAAAFLTPTAALADRARSAQPARPAPDACWDAGEALCMPIQFQGEVPTPHDGERLVGFGRALARGSNAPVRIEGPGAGDRVQPNAIPTLSQMRAEKVARLLETGGLPWDRIERVSAPRWRVVGP
jgi:hypothetical protein